MPKPTSDRRATERKHPWPMVRLGDVCEVVLGGTPKTGITEYWDGDIPWLTPGDMGKITQMYVDASNCKRKISQLGLDNGSTLCPARSVILSTRAPIGYAFVNSVPMATNQGCKTLVPSDDVYPEYLCFNLLGRTDELNELGTGTTFKELATGRLKAMTLPLPPLSVQREIVARLERELAVVEKIKEGFEALAETANAEFKAELKEVFEEISRGGAETRRLGEIGRVVTGTTPSKGNKSFYGGEWPFYKPADLNQGHNTIESGDSLTDIGWQNARQLPANSVLVTCIGATLGKTGIIRRDGACNQQINAIVCDESALTEYVYYSILSPQFQSMLWIASNSTTLPMVNKSTFEKFEIPFPPLSVQREVVARLDGAKAKAEKLAAKAREGVAVCETMRKAILKEAFAPCCAGEVA